MVKETPVMLLESIESSHDGSGGAGQLFYSYKKRGTGAVLAMLKGGTLKVLG